ncbi:AAA family ATPase [Haliea sp. E1-2-M8]|uniref:ExeA family protein n=1 Tax=Haliea sp. E1-2-M8 TaxID=3064706 RepID=UPI002727BCE8|nr:AAA family ATPase [Haliea sp. E1-2-M8]MDO8860435.1 AAA family ATPase [Haliea sp. E1-2-M8]
MYQQFYSLSAEPFRLSPDHDFAYAHKGYMKARAYMAYAFIREEGFVMITGRPGTGKTTLIGSLIEHLGRENVKVANLVCSQLKADDLLKMVAYDFGISLDIVEKGELLQRLTLQLRAWRRDGRRALLIVDEAQNLAVTAMEELRLLTNIQVDGRPLLQIFLLGQPELRELMLRPELEQVHQRIVAASHLRPLQLEETQAYVMHRLEVVGWSGDPAFNTAVFPLLHKFSEGIPRRINLICSRLLLHCALEQRHRVEVADVREVILELQDENLAAGSTWNEADFSEPSEPEPQAAAPEQPADPVKNRATATTAKKVDPEPVAPGTTAGHASEGDLPPVAGDAAAAAESAPKPPSQRLKVVVTAPEVEMRRTGTDSRRPDPRPPKAEAGRINLEPVTAPEARVASLRRTADNNQVPAPTSPPPIRKRAARAAQLLEIRPTVPKPGEGLSGAPPVRDYTGAWANGLIFLLSVASVFWAASGFDIWKF